MALLPKNTTNNAHKEVEMQIKAESIKNWTVCKNQILRGTYVAQIRKLKTNERYIKVSVFLSKYFRKRSLSRMFNDFLQQVHNKSTPQTFDASEANYWHKKPKRKDTMKLLQKQQLHDSRKQKIKIGLPPNKRFSLTPFS